MRRAGCLCGAVRIELEGEPLRVRTCMCRDCQYFGAGIGTVNAAYARADVRTTGDVHWYESVADSGNTVRRGFCPACGTPLFTSSSGHPDFLGVRVGTFEEPGSVTPSETIWTDSAPGWACIADDLPTSPRQAP